MRVLLTVPLTALPSGAFAHGFHVGDLAGHDHVVIGVVIGGLILAGILAGASGAKDKDDEALEDDNETPAEA